MNHETSKGRIAITAASALLLLGGLGLADPVAASTVVVVDCVGVTWVWNFDNPLGLSGQNGNVFVESWAPHNVCPYAGVSGLSATEGVVIFAGSFTAPFIGDCLHATVFMGDGEIHIIGGTLIVGTGGSGDVTWQIVGVFPVTACGFYSTPSVVNLSAEAIDAKDVEVKVAFVR